MDRMDLSVDDIKAHPLPLLVGAGVGALGLLYLALRRPSASTTEQLHVQRDDKKGDKKERVSSIRVSDVLPV